MAGVLNTAKDVLSTGIQLEADPAGYFQRQQAQQAAEQQRQATAQALTPLLQGYGASPEQINATTQLPAEQQFNVGNQLRQGQQFQLATQKEGRQAKADEKRAQQLDKYYKIQEGNQRLTAKNIDLRNRTLDEQIADKNERRAARNDAVNMYGQHISALPGNQQVQAKALLASAKSTGNFKDLDMFLRPEKPKPGTPAGFFAAAQNGEVNTKDPNAVDNYFKQYVKDPKQANAAIKNFKSAYQTDPGSAAGWFSAAQAPKFNPQGQAALQPPQQPQTIQQAPAQGQQPAAGYTPQQEAGINAVMQTNPGVSRDQAIQALKQAGKL